MTRFGLFAITIVEICKVKRSFCANDEALASIDKFFYNKRYAVFATLSYFYSSGNSSQSN